MNYYESPRWSNEIADCSMPMTFDTYSNCSFSCIYCFSQYQRSLGKNKESYTQKTDVKFVNIDKIKKIFLHPESSQFGEYIKQRKTMQWGGLSDQFDGFERVHGKTLELLRFFKEIDYPLCFSTKSVWWTEDERYRELFRDQKNWNVKISIITLDEKAAKDIEKSVETPMRRLEAIKNIHELNCGGATLRLRPFIIGVSNPTHTELIELAAKNGASALSTEFFCLDLRSNSLKSNLYVINKHANFDLEKYYKLYSYGKGYLRLNRNVKRKFIDEMQETAHKNGMRFYVSDAHFKERCDNGSCCGLPESWNYSRGQFCEALMIAKKNGKVRYSDIQKDIENLHNSYKFTNACGYNVNNSEKRAKFYGMSMGEYLRYLWNNPMNGQSPYTLFEGVLKPDGKDEAGNIIYAIDKERL